MSADGAPEDLEARQNSWRGRSAGCLGEQGEDVGSSSVPVPVKTRLRRAVDCQVVCASLSLQDISAASELRRTMLQPQQLIQVPGPTDGLAVVTSKTSNIGSLVQYNTGSPPSTIDASPVLEMRQEHKNVGGGSRGKAAKLFTPTCWSIRNLHT